MSNAGDIKTLDKMQNVGYTCHLLHGSTHRQAIFAAAAKGTAAGDICDCFLEFSVSWRTGKHTFFPVE